MSRYSRSAFALFAFAWFSQSGFAAKPSYPLLNLFGDDDRQDITTADGYPYAAVGHLDNDCTGTVIGTRLVLTAAHCVVDSSSGAAREDIGYFRTNLLNGRSTEKSSVERMWVGTHNPEEFRDRDWAILKLSQPVKRSVQALALEAVDFAKAGWPYSVDLPGYSMDRNRGGNLSVHRGCHILKAGKAGAKEDRPVFFEDCDSYAGISGAPLLAWRGNTAVVVGIAVSEFRSSGKVSVHRDEYSDNYANVAIAVTEAARAFETLSKTAELGLAVPKIAGVYELAGTGISARVCKPYDGGQVAGVAFNPAISNEDKSLVDWKSMEKFAKDASNGTGENKTIDNLGLQKLAAERSGPAWGLTQQQCAQSLREQRNGLVCGGGLAYNIFRVKDAARLGGNEAGYAFYNFDQCQRAVRFSTSRLVCAWNGLLNVTAVRIADGTHEKDFRRYINSNNDAFEECLTYLAQNP